jgi:hypothetical protein
MTAEKNLSYLHLLIGVVYDVVSVDVVFMLP